MALILAAWIRVATWLALVPAAAPLVQGDAVTAPAPEYQLKAVFLFHFAQFVQWPAEALPDSAGPLVIGVFGEDPFGPYLDDAVRGETVQGHPLVVQRYRTVQEIGTCHILFVSPGEAGRYEALRSALGARSVLTVSDAAGFDAKGGMIRFVTERNRIRLRINLAAARDAGLTLSSKLLRAAEIVDGAGS